MKLLMTYGLMLFGLILFAVSAPAQRLQFDVELKAGYGPMVGNNEDNSVDHSEYFPIQGGVHIGITQHLAVGGFYARSLQGSVKYDNSNSSGKEAPLETLMYGIDLRLSAGRASRFRPYLTASYGKAEFVQDATLDQPYRLAHSGKLIGLNGGVMLRFGRNFYWNIIEASGKYVTKIWWLDSDLCIEFKTGILYHIRLKSK